MKKISMMLIGCTTLITFAARATDNCPLSFSSVGTPGQSNNEWGVTDLSNCGSTVVRYYNWTDFNGNPKYYQITSCTACNGDYELTETSSNTMPVGGDSGTGDRCYYTYRYCKENTVPTPVCGELYSASTCENGSWTSVVGGRAFREEVSEDENGCCERTTVYKCDVGYYGNGTTCNQCPYGSSTSDVGAESRSECCFLSADSAPLNDGNSNTYHYAQECCLSNDPNDD